MGCRFNWRRRWLSMNSSLCYLYKSIQKEHAWRTFSRNLTKRFEWTEKSSPKAKKNVETQPQENQAPVTAAAHTSSGVWVQIILREWQNINQLEMSKMDIRVKLKITRKWLRGNAVYVTQRFVGLCNLFFVFDCVDN